MRTGVVIECMALDDMNLTYGPDGRMPRFEKVPALCPVLPGQKPPIGEALSLRPPDGEALGGYLEAVHRTLWAYAERHHGGDLDGGRRQGRPPVLKAELAARNILVPPDGSLAEEIRGSVAARHRHRHFASLRGSHPLTQSVFGAISASGRLDLLASVSAECGRPAFFEDRRGWTLDFEHEVETLGEPRPTGIDVLLSGPNRRVAVECKFTEEGFGTCSRPRLQPGDAGYPAERCDGSYRAQAGRSDRCALTAFGVRYWDHLPRLFACPADRDHEPCPFGAVYQLARNALAAVVTPDGDVDPAMGHALVIYDARNPAFQAGGDADRQWEDAVGACLVPGLMRRLSWQRLLTFIAEAPNLTWLVDALRDKYDLVPD